MDARYNEFIGHARLAIAAGVELNHNHTASKEVVGALLVAVEHSDDGNPVGMCVVATSPAMMSALSQFVRWTQTVGAQVIAAKDVDPRREN